MKRITGRVVFTLLSNGVLAVAVFAVALTAHIGTTPPATALYTAASCNRNDVDAVINGPVHAAVNGDTILIPAGSCTWTTGVTVPLGVGITVKGAGTPTNNPLVIGADASCSATTITSNASGGAVLFAFAPGVDSPLTRVSCIKFRSDLDTSKSMITVSAAGLCKSTTCSNIRFDNLIFDESMECQACSVLVSDNVFGVIDHNTVGVPDTAFTAFWEFLNYHNSSWDGIGDDWGDSSWASPTTFGTGKALYVENNYLGRTVVASESETSAALRGKGGGGGRITARFNTCDGCNNGFVSHGTQQRRRSARQTEVYGNSYYCRNVGYGCGGITSSRGAMTLTFGNTFSVESGAWFSALTRLSNFRYYEPQGPSPWGACDGTGPYDQNEGVVYDSGTVTAVSVLNNQATIADNTKSWTTNQWATRGSPHSFHNVTRSTGATIQSNNATSFVMLTMGQTPSVQVGDAYHILRTVCMDDPARGPGVLLSGYPTPVPIGFVNQPRDAVYQFLDSGVDPVPYGGSNVVADINLRENVDLYTDNSRGTPHLQTSASSPFNGTVGVGVGVIARRPTTCTPRVGYWATDEGNWNQSGNGFGQGRLYVCTATNTWTLYYTPYTYPHPVITGIAAPGAPTNLRIIRN